MNCQPDTFEYAIEFVLFTLVIGPSLCILAMLVIGIFHNFKA